MSTSPECRAVRELIPEVALGITTGEERAEALQHLVACPSCRKLLDDLSDLVDEMLLLAPAREPPIGFETRVIERLNGKGHPRRWPRVALGLVAAALVAVIVAGSVLIATADDRRLADAYRDTLRVANGEYFSAAPLRGPHGTIGHVFGYQGSPSWVFVTVEDPGRAGAYRVEVVSADRRIPLGWIRVHDGQGSWGGVLPVDYRDADVLRLVGDGDDRTQPIRALLH